MLLECRLAEEAMRFGEQRKQVRQRSIPVPSGSSLTGELTKKHRYL